MDSQDSDDPPRRRNITYDLINSLIDKLNKNLEQTAVLLVRDKDRGEDAKDHETRIRSLETNFSTFSAANAKSTGVWTSVWMGAFMVLNAFLDLGTLLILLLRNQHA